MLWQRWALGTLGRKKRGSAQVQGLWEDGKGNTWPKLSGGLQLKWAEEQRGNSRKQQWLGLLAGVTAEKWKFYHYPSWLETLR